MDIQDTIKILQENISYIDNDAKVANDIINAFGLGLGCIPPDQLNLAFKNQGYFQQVSSLTKIYSVLEHIPISNNIIVYIHPLRLWISPEDPEILDTISTFGPQDARMTRIIFEHKERKIIFMCDKNKEMIRSMKIYIRKTLGYTSIVDDTMPLAKVTIDKFASDREYKSIIQNIKNHMCLMNREFSESITLEIPKIGKLGKYYERDVSNFEITKHEVEGTHVTNITINGPVTIVNGNHNKIIKYKKTKEFDSAIANWVIENPPMDLTKVDYFQKFLDAKVCKIGMNQLSTIMFNIGYETDRTSQPPKWKK